METHLSDHQLEHLLLDLNFDENKVTRFLKGLHLDAARDLLISYKPTYKKGRQGKYQHLRLSDSPRNKNWVLFDPCKRIPDVHNDHLRLLVRFAIYKPGNKRFLEFNVRNGNFRLRSVGKVFMGKYVSYMASGPVLVPFESGFEEEGEKPVRGRKEKQDAATMSEVVVLDGSESELTEIESEG